MAQTKIAYFIMAHHKPQEFLRLLNAIYVPEHIYLIHIDAKADDLLHETARLLSQDNQNIYMLPSRSLTWGGWSLVQAEIDAIRELLHLHGDWTHYINLSGQDFPLMSQSRIMESIDTGKNYITIKEMTFERRNLEKYFVEEAGEVRSLGDRPPFEQYFPTMKPFTGTQWKVLTRQFAEFAVNSPLAFRLQDYFRYTFIPDENYFATLIENSDFRDTVINNHFRYILMNEREDLPGVASADVLRTDDIPYMLSSKQWFARKFDLEVDSAAVDYLEMMIFDSPLKVE